MNEAVGFLGLLESRLLTPGEVDIARALFGAAVDWAGVRVMQLPPLGFWAMVPLGRTILYSRLRARRDFADAPAEEQGVFVHELAHVWQAGRGVVLAFAKLSALGRSAYRYAAREGARLDDYNIESQAEIARHLFLARRGYREDGAPARAWLEGVWSGASRDFRDRRRSA
ncbi:MAG TPA: hypothetical protein VG841_00540 [Caulobacterales bacterium]|nr:hypothetical protein [Caulobacterales bacterium]